jgi:hypothetical protein
MAITYSEVVPWGRSFDEYRHMFHLTDEDLQRRILGCGDGPAAFNARMWKNGLRVVSCDPLYQLSAEQIRRRIDVTYEQVLGQTRKNLEKFVWTHIKSLDELGRVRLASMMEFLDDYEDGRRAGRYLIAQLPNLPFGCGAFDLALCSHFLFLYTDNLSLQFHQQAVEEMFRVANEVRIFPLLDYNARTSPFVEPIGEALEQAGFSVAIEKVDYEFQRGGDHMMRITRRAP